MTDLDSQECADRAALIFLVKALKNAGFDLSIAINSLDAMRERIGAAAAEDAISLALEHYGVGVKELEDELPRPEGNRS